MQTLSSSETPAEYLVVMKRNPKFNTSPVEILTIEKNLDWKLKLLKINDGVNLYIEDKWIPHPQTLEYNFLLEN